MPLVRRGETSDYNKSRTWQNSSKKSNNYNWYSDQVTKKESSPRRPSDLPVKGHACQGCRVLLSYKPPVMVPTALLSARGVRFKETVISSHYGGSRDTASSCTGSWGSDSPTPLTVCGPLTIFSFVVPAKSQKLSYRERKIQIKRVISENPNFQDGLLLETREKGVMFPVVYMAENAEFLTSQPAIGVLERNDLTLYQGVYQEVRHIVPETELPRVAPFPQQQHNIGYMLLGFKSLDRKFSQIMLDTWKDWTGARYIYMYLPDDLGLRKITFYHRQLPDDLNLFMYLVLVECHGITDKDKQVRLLDFAQRMRLERMTGYISVYVGERGDKETQSASPFHIHDLIETKKKSDITESLFSNGIVPRNTRV